MTEIYIYPQWYSAIRSLRTALSLSNSQNEILTEWFKNHVFEVGNDTQINDRVFEKMEKDEITKYKKYHASRAISDLIVENGLYMHEETKPSPWYLNMRVSVLVFGSPKMVGAEKRIKY